MSARFEELARVETGLGTISLRRRREPTLDVDVYEVKRDDEFLMSSLFTVAEAELARLAIAQLAGSGLDVVVGGLGLGYTAATVLEHARVRSLIVVETVAAVIDWHERGLLPDVGGVTSDPRTRLVNGDFFAMARDASGFDPSAPGRRFDTILVDIDHTPRHVLDPSHAALYSRSGLRDLTDHLHPGGVFALWSNDPPDAVFVAAAEDVFAAVEAHEVTFPNVHTGGEAANTVYVATTAQA